MIGKLDEHMRFHQTALRLRSERQEVLASNIANADTPNYKARDLDFGGTLKQALNGSQVKAPNGADKLVKTSARHLEGLLAGTTLSGAQLLYRTNAQGNVDGNTVDMDAERNQFIDNALRYEAGATFANGQLRTLMSAVQGQ